MQQTYSQTNQQLLGSQEALLQGMKSHGQIGLPHQQGEIESQIDMLSNQLKSIQVLVCQANDRFSPALSGQAGISGNVKELPPLYSQLGNQLSLLNSSATQIRSDLQELIDRCKL